MKTRAEVDQLKAEVDYCRDRAALLRAKLYRWGLASNPRLQALERELARAEERLHDAKS